MWFEVLVALIVAAVVSVLLHYYLQAAQKTDALYTKPGWSLVYYLRWARGCLLLWRLQHQRRPRLNNYRSGSKDYQYCGLVPTPQERRLEAPVTLTTDRHEDEVVVWGRDREGRSVYARLLRLAGGKAAVVLLVRDQHGDIYTIPNQPSSSVCYCDGRSWRGAGLLLECVEPMRTWRLKFSGPLRKGPRQQYSTIPCPEDDAGVVEARLDLVWRALRDPIDLFRDSSPLLLAEALAREPDADLRYFTSLDRDAYNQHGTLAGTVVLGEEGSTISCTNTSNTTNTTSSTNSSTTNTTSSASLPADEPPLWYLRGGRQHRWGMSEAATKLHRSVELLSFMDNGDCLYLHAFCYPASLTHCTFGYLQTVTYEYLPLTSCSFELSGVGEDGSLPTHVFFTCTAGGRQLQVLVNLPHGWVLYYTGDPWTLQHHVTFSDVFVGSNKGSGMAVFTRSYNDLCPVPEHAPIHLREDSDIEDGEEGLEGSTSPPLVAAIGDPRCRDPSLAGGKGASLSVLSSLLQEESPEKFTVPAGVVVTTASWRRHLLSKPNLSAVLLNIEKAVGSAQDSQIKDACQKACEVFRRAGVCEEVRQATIGALQELYDDTDPQMRFAVRSSGCEEDGSEASAAGQNLTVLGCKGLAGVLAALPSCWASLLDYNSVQYRRQRGLTPVGEMGVVVQEMVAPQVAGVIFTREPTTGSPSSITITANYGLGESVVSGSSEPDTIVVRRSWRDELAVASTTVGAKATRQVVRGEGGEQGEGGVLEEEVSAAARGVCCVSPALALRLASLAVHLERAFASPRDIEFAVLQDRLYLLQARPITSLDSWSELELRLELDSAVVTDKELLTRANTGEVFPGPTTPLSISVVVGTLDMALQQQMTHLSYNFHIDHVGGRCCFVSHLHTFLNMMEVLYRNLTATLTAAHQAVDLAVFGHQVTTPTYHKLAITRYGALTDFKSIKLALYSLFNVLQNKRRVRRARDLYERYSIRTGRAVGAHALYQEICRRIPDLTKMGRIHSLTSSCSSFTQIIAFAMLAEGSNVISDSNISDMASLLSSCCEGQNSAGVPAALSHLSSVVRRDEECGEFQAMTCDEGAVWLGSHPRAVGDAYQRFIEQHGHRCIKEFELASVSWGMDSRSLVATLQSMVAASVTTQPREAAAAGDDIDAILDSLTTKLQRSTRRGLSWILPRCRDSVQLRETTKSFLIRTVDAFRRAYRTLGELLVSEGRLPEAELVFYLQHHELGLLLDRRSPALIAKALGRRRLLVKMESIQLPEISEGRPEPLVVDDCAEGADPSCRERVVTGTPVCLGKARGQARVITHFKDAPSIQSGDILITYSTDVGWTPYFPLLAGVVTEIGGLVSHGAVVAREYGLPCVVGASGAMRVVQTGEMIELNGNTGTITRIGPPTPTTPSPISFSSSSSSNNNNNKS